ncbi:MAG: hypothetical protein ACLSAF_22210 [Intestinimonas sp.]
MKHLYEYINEIMDIASVNHAEPQNAKDMFLANIRNAGDPTLPHYRGAGDVDYAALAEDLPRLTNEGAALTQALFDHYKALVELHRAGRYAEAVELMRGLWRRSQTEFLQMGAPQSRKALWGGGRTARSGHPAGSRMKQSGVSSDDE